MPNANAIQIGGSHYKSGEVEHWDVMDDCKVGYLEGCASKYVLRWRRKNGVEDLRKAAHFMRKLYELRSDMSHAECAERMPNVPHAVISHMCEGVGLCGADEQIIRHILTWQSTATIDLARRMIEGLIAEVETADGSEACSAYVNQD